MNWLEIINIRSFKSNVSDIQSTFNELIGSARDKWPGNDIVLLQHSRLASDYSILIHHRSENPEIRGSQPGIHLVFQLQEFGYVNHTIWQEPKKQKGK